MGLSYAKGLKLAIGCALLGIPSLDTLALTALAEISATPAGRLICPVLDARKGEVYAALYRTSGDGLEKLSDDLVVTLENLAPHLGTDVVLVGDAKAEEACALVRARGRPGDVPGNNRAASCEVESWRRWAPRGWWRGRRIMHSSWNRCT